MLKINDAEYNNITKETFIFSNAIYNKTIGYIPFINIEFVNDNIKGYINIDLDFNTTVDINNYVNKTIVDNPCNDKPKIGVIEIFDTKMFYDFIDSEVNISFKNILNNKIETKILINDENIKLEYNGYLEILDIKK